MVVLVMGSMPWVRGIGRDIFDSGESGGDSYEVPEPGVLELLGIGLIVLSRRRRAA
jgi:hypothetical protein